MSEDIGEQIAELTAAIRRASSTSAAEQAAKAGLRNIRAPSMAAMIGTGPRMDAAAAAIYPAHPSLKASLGADYQPGSFITALMNVAPGSNPDAYYQGKAALEALGLEWRDMPEVSKATLGTTGATGGYVLPNNLVETVQKPEVAEAIYADLVTVRTGVNVRGVDQPIRSGAPSRMTFQDWGVTKENVNEAYGSYTANLGTMARIYDLAKQYVRFSAGAAEQDVIDELTKAARLGENFYILAGAGTGSVGTGDPTTGVYTALAAASAFQGFTTTFSGASNSTVAGSAATGLATAYKALATRSVRPTATVMDAVTYFSLLTQGSDTAGFWVSPDGGPNGFSVLGSGQLAFWGVPMYYDPNFDTNTGTTKRAITGDWKSLRLYRGMEFRIESSDQAGSRWDQNLVGFRGEQEIGVHAGAAVQTGHFQLIAALIP